VKFPWNLAFFAKNHREIWHFPPGNKLGPSHSLLFSVFPSTCLGLGYCYCLSLYISYFLKFILAYVFILLCIVAVCRRELKSWLIDWLLSAYTLAATLSILSSHACWHANDALAGDRFLRPSVRPSVGPSVLISLPCARACDDAHETQRRRLPRSPTDSTISQIMTCYKVPAGANSSDAHSPSAPCRNIHFINLVVA